MRFAAVLFLCAFGLMAQDARDALNRGVQAFKNGRYAQAVTEFQKAVDLDPSFPTAHLYLATALMQQYIPGAESAENAALFQRASGEFRRVLEIEPGNKVALSSLASLDLNAKKWDEARAGYKTLLNVDPDNAEAYYSLAFITWAQWYPEYTKARADAGMRPETPGPIPDPAVRSGLRGRWWSALDEAVWDLNQAMARRPQYGDAMAYMNLLVRERADLRDSPAEHQRDIAEADQWVRRAIEAKRAGAGQSVGMGIGMSAPPPPPPPPTAAPPGSIRVGDDLQARKLVSQKPPVYPPDAKAARIQGVVKLSAVVGKDGHVQRLDVLSGHPLLVPAAIEAVKEWVYEPTLLNGEPVAVVTQISVNFTLSQ